MSIAGTILAKARAAWDAVIEQERKAQKLQERLIAARKAVAAFHKCKAAGWAKLSDEACDQVCWSVLLPHLRDFWQSTE